jgi:hypothetical protein
MAKRARYPAGTVIDGVPVGGRFMPTTGRGDLNIYFKVKQRRDETGEFLGELKGKTQKAAMIGAQMGAAAVRARIRQEFNQRTGTLINSVQAVPRGSTGAAIVVGAEHALWLNEGSRPHIIRPRPPKTLLKWPATHGGTAGAAPIVDHPGTNGTYLGFVEDSIEAFEEEIGEAIVEQLKV